MGRTREEPIKNQQSEWRKPLKGREGVFFIDSREDKKEENQFFPNNW